MFLYADAILSANLPDYKIDKGNKFHYTVYSH